MHKSNCVLCPERRRHVPPRFSWIDHRLIREEYVQQCGVVALALYLVLVTVSDRNGMSFYSDRSLCRLLGVPMGDLSRARERLRGLKLIAWETPFYQVLSLDPPPPPVQKPKEPETIPATPEEIQAVVQRVERLCGRRI